MPYTPDNEYREVVYNYEATGVTSQELPTDLERVYFLFSTTIIGYDLLPLQRCRELKSVIFERNPVKSLNLTPLSKCAELEEFILKGSKLTAIDLEPLHSCKNLKTVVIKDSTIDKIDLSPLSACMNLQRLEVSGNKLKHIDLSPLESCQQLEQIDLSANEIQEIDLSPLVSFNKLYRLILEQNQIQEIDLNPLKSCRGLSQISISKNRISDIDLTPLRFHSNLRSIDLGSNNIRSLDLLPLTSCHGIYAITFARTSIVQIDITPLILTNNKIRLADIGIPKNAFVTRWLDTQYSIRRGFNNATFVQASSWEPLHRLLIFGTSDYKYSHAVLHALGLDYFGLIDDDISPFLKSITPDTPLNEVRELIIRRITQIVSKQIDNGGVTIGIDCDQLLTLEGLAEKVASIINLRKSEMEEVIVPIRKGTADLIPLWLTSYGFDILAVLGAGLSAGKSVQKKIGKALGKLGFELRTTTKNEQSPITKISEEMKRYILWLAIWYHRTPSSIKLINEI